MPPVKIDIDILDTKNSSTKFFYLLLATDFIFITLHLIHRYSDLISSSYFSLIQERGYAEVFQYIKEYWITLSLFFLATKYRSILYLIWSLLFGYILLDDSLEIHENLGAFIGEKLGLIPALNLRARDFGEVIVSACIGLAFLLAIAICYRFGDRVSRQTSRYLIVMLLALALVGIVVDLLHIILEQSWIEPFLAILEDGGEMIVMSIIVWFIFQRTEKLPSVIFPEASKPKASSYQD